MTAHKSQTCDRTHEHQPLTTALVQLQNKMPQFETPPPLFRLLSPFFHASTLPRPILFRRWLSFSLACLATYVLLDRGTVDLQIWHGISAWHPPIGFEFALYLGLGRIALPPLFLAGFVAGFLNYHESPSSLEFLLINPLIPILYYVAARSVKKRLHADLRLHSMRDVVNLLLYSLAASLSRLSSAPPFSP